MVGVARGSIDDRFRPTVRLPLARGGDDFLALVDTGFNGALLCNRLAAASLGVVPEGVGERVELAGGIEQVVQHGWLQIVWLGRSRHVRVLVSPVEPIRAAIRDGEPVALLGAALLTPHLVLLDYGKSTVEIEGEDY